MPVRVLPGLRQSLPRWRNELSHLSLEVSGAEIAVLLYGSFLHSEDEHLARLALIQRAPRQVRGYAPFALAHPL